jgi:hypothetical protein
LKQLIDLWRATDKPPFGLDLPWTNRDIGKGYFLLVVVCFIVSSGLFAKATRTGALRMVLSSCG